MKKCKGTGNAKGFGCGIELPYSERNGIKTYNATYGLGHECKCYYSWLSGDSEKAKEILYKTIIKGKEKLKKEKRLKHRKLKNELNSSKNMGLADIYFSRYIRVLNSVNGNCTCYTCGVIKPIKNVDNGHFIKREHKATRYHEKNCKPQCKTCNGDIKHNGKQLEFRENLVREYDEETVRKLEKLGKSNFQMTALDYKNKADEYRIKLNELQKELNIKYW